jgi:hypothetical protein
MVAIAIEGCLVSPKTLIFGIVIGQTELARPVASAFDPKMIVAIFRQFAVATGAFQHPLP